jgi:hypothetical protein
LAMASILGKPGSPGQFPTHDLSTVWGALHPTRSEPLLDHSSERALS